MQCQDISKQLNHQRVRQILSDHIPDDEAKLLSNGRLTCMICQHRPIFDCVKTLSQHRKGKKHLIELGKYLKCKSEHDYQKLKHKQQKELKPKGIVKSDKSKPKYLRRKMVLSPSTLLKSASVSSDIPNLQRLEDLDLVQQSAVTQVKKYLKSITRKNGFEKSLEQAKDSYGVNTSSQSQDIKSVNTQSKVSAYESQTVLSKQHSNYDKSLAEHELKLKMAGWIKDSTGKWLKNPDVEFDSDEDEPPVQR